MSVKKLLFEMSVIKVLVADKCKPYEICRRMWMYKEKYILVKKNCKLARVEGRPHRLTMVGTPKMVDSVNELS